MSKDLKVNVENKLSNIPDNIEKDANRFAVKIAGLVEGSQDSLAAAKDALEGESETVKAGKDYIRTLLAPCKDAIALLDLLSQVHPAVSAVAGVFKVVVQLELDRQDNDRRIAALYFQMTDVLFVFSYLNPVFEDEKDDIRGKLKKQLQEISKTINEFGNFCENHSVYYKHNSFIRTILSGKYKGKLAEFSKGFTARKKQLSSLVSHKSALSISNIKSRLDSVSCKIDNVLRAFETMDPKEREVNILVKQLGGESAVFESDQKLDKLASDMGERLTSAMKYTLRSDFEEVLKANVSLYELKVEATERRIRDAVERSTETILLKLDSGPHDAVEDEDIRAVWKDMVLPPVLPSIQVAKIVTAMAKYLQSAALSVQHYFAMQFASYQLLHGEPHPEKWTLEFISKVIFYPAIGDAIDDDGSGFISIYEVNRFTRRKPDGWKTPEWLAYWGIGWYRNAITYKKWCLKLLSYIENSEYLLHPANVNFMGEYLGREGMGDVRLIVESVYTNRLSVLGQNLNLSHERFNFLRIQKMNEEMDMVRSRLVKTKFQIDSPMAVNAICGTHKLENTFLCLLSVLLMHHKQVLKVAENAMLSEQEFVNMVGTVKNATTAFESRLYLLLECWRQQRMEARLQLQSFASGLFEDWWFVYHLDDDEDEDGFELADIRNYEDDAESDDGDAADRILPSPESPTGPANVLTYPIPPQPKDVKRQNSIMTTSTASLGTTSMGTVSLTGSVRSLERVPMSRRQVKELDLKNRMDAMENRLANIETLLFELASKKTNK
ncbi:hypothetical protein PQX77_003914 [Marasmius sp. AFHP31]|nr:hypothetical protein PQX77_003914 [Marasmius sp. AFHP31]